MPVCFHLLIFNVCSLRLILKDGLLSDDIILRQGHHFVTERCSNLLERLVPCLSQISAAALSKDCRCLTSGKYKYAITRKKSVHPTKT